MVTTPTIPAIPTTPTSVPAAPAQSLIQTPEEVWAIFCGTILEVTTQRLVDCLTTAMASNVKRVHILFQSAGGTVGDGVFLYNMFRALPIPVTLYNAGQLSSAAVIAYLGAKGRKTSASGTFMIHRSTNSSQFATSSKLQHLAKALVLDDERTEAILRNHVTMPDELWTELKYNDLYLSGKEAIKFGIADDIGDFAPPPGTQVTNLLT
jgi:ATP-dependent Clp protease, protease subunit